MAAEEDVPPLEDMSELIKQVDALREMKRAQESEHGTSMHNGHHNRKNSKIANASGSQNTVAQKSVPSKRAEQNKTDCLQSSAKQCSETSVGEGSRKTVEKKQNGAGFGGLKKGFLFGGSSKLKSAKEKSCSDTSVVNANSVGATSNVGQSRQTLEDIPFVTKNEEAKTKNLQFSEVQEAMAKTNEKLMENKEWVTDDLLNKLEKNEKLSRRLQDPRFIQAISDFQKNPQEALQKYGNSPDIQEFFKDFCGLMGDHFSKLGDKPSGSGVVQPPAPSAPKVVTKSPASGADMSVRSSTDPRQATAQDEARMQQILSDPEIRTVLMDPKIQELFEALRNNPDTAQRILQTSSGELKGKIHKLVQAGLLQFQGT